MTMTYVPLMRRLRRLVGPTIAAPDSDAALLERFVRQRDQDAFAALVDRHGRMVLRVCRRVLGDHHAAEDVFQGAFLMLARRAGSIRHGAALAGWLHAVALRLAIKARAAASRRPAGLAQGSADPADTRPDPLAELSARDAAHAVDQELERLGEVYRLPVLLCCIEGLSQEEAAQRLGWSAGSVKGRLERGRKRLHARLVRRGLTLAAALAASELARAHAGAAVPAGLASTTVTAGLAFAGLSQQGLPPTCVAAAQLASEWLPAAGMSRLRMLVAAILMLGLVAGGVGAFAWFQRSEPHEEAPPIAAIDPAPQQPQPQRKDDDKTSPHFEGTALPEPPEQTQPWTPPGNVPKGLVSATTALFDAGMADPRGGEYRTVVVGTGDCWQGDAGRFQTHAWVLPAPAGAAPRFAVGWNGLVYPIVSVGDRADLAADIRAMLKKDDEARAKFAKNPPRPDAKFGRYHPAWSERTSLASDSLVPLKACMLLRLGEGELAREVWLTWMLGIWPNVDDGSEIIRDPYLTLATDWAWALFDRALGAHMRGDDRLALLSARALSKAQKVIDAEAQRRGYKRPPIPPPAAQSNEPRPYLPFLTELPTLLADQERRAKEPRAATKALPTDKTKRIAVLIRDLENVTARQMGQPGGVRLNMDGTVAALVQEGEAAALPLLKCLEEDQRLTRSVSFHRDFFMHRHVVGVHEAAYAALTEILKTRNFNSADLLGGLEKRRKLADAIRQYWVRVRGVPLEERWFRVLADADATVSEWVEAANHIVAKDEAGALRGEALRNKDNPSVAGLLARRIDGLCQPYQADQAYMDKLGQAYQLAVCLDKWCPKTATPILAELVRLTAKYIPEAPSVPTAYERLSEPIARMTQLRVKAGDKSALSQYAVWLRTVGPTSAVFSYLPVFAPMWEHPDDPDMRAVAQTMFGDDRSPWAERFLLTFNMKDLFDTPMLKLAPFRKRMLAELAKKDKAGIVTITDEGYGQLKMDTGWSGGAGVDPRKDPLAPKGPANLVFRVCDYYAWQLSRTIKGAPRCELYWPEADRDRAVAACAAFLKRYDERR